MPKSNYQGSKTTYKMVAAQIAKRWGQREVKNYRPESNCLPFRVWSEAGYRIKKGSKALKSVTYVEAKDKETDEVIRKFPKTVNLFYIKQVEKIKAQSACRAKI